MNAVRKKKKTRETETYMKHENGYPGKSRANRVKIKTHYKRNLGANQLMIQFHGRNKKYKHYTTCSH